MTFVHQPFRNHNGKKLSLLDMPTEIRYMIYTCLFVEGPSNHNTTVNMRTDAFHLSRPQDCHVRPFAADFNYNSLGIFATCKSIYQEVKPVFWAYATFVFETTAELDIFLQQRSIYRGPRLLTNLALVQYVRLVNDDINNVDHVFRERVLSRLANGQSIVSLVIQHGVNWPCWCERCQDVQEVFDVEWKERWAERVVEEARIEELEEQHEGGLEQTLAENEEDMKGFEHLFEAD
ncbi:unnamed protein product [Aureobasidium uvarum]|uniref:Uncharacterized protein n=1 Tax=Aureobasidium uvarum TaxID=2773716 RepID=A0A9N8PSW8_9PEZI|nr:unnamed protein product [Aureobasidium uvarum]